jgi:hypothetical protein
MHLKNARTIEVDADRLAEIQESYSGDTIASEHTIRKPFKFEGNFYVSTGGFSGPNIVDEEECYILVPMQDFKDAATYYGKKLMWPATIREEEKEYAEDWDAQRRCQPEGFYHRMLIKRGKSEWVLIGPPILFKLKENSVETKQLSLF